VTTATLINEPRVTTVIASPLSFEDVGWHALFAQVECGDYHDNLSAFLTMRYAMRKGYRDEGLQKIEELRTQIIEREEAKSSKWLLPELDTCLKQSD
jgi:hypothetical protein